MKIDKGDFRLSDGTNLPYEIYGSEHKNAIPLVLIMGLSGVKEDWHPVVEAFGKYRPTLMYDRRGIGESKQGKPENSDADWEEPELTLDLEANDLINLLLGLGEQFKKVNILGWSMGGHILQALLLLPKVQKSTKGGVEIQGIHIEKVILAATMPKLPRGEFKPNVLEPILATADKDPKWKEKVTEAMMSYQYDPDWLIDSKNTKLFKERCQVALKTRRPQRVIAAQGAAIAQRDTRKELSKIPNSLPVLIIHGKLDRMVGYSESDLLITGIKHAKRLDYSPNHDKFGHFWFDYFGADWWAKKVETFLSNQSARI